MSLSVGQSLSSYEILAPLGAGGMGEVFRARDRKLDRDVAIKVLPAELADGRSRPAWPALRAARRRPLGLAERTPTSSALYGFESVETHDASGTVHFLVTRAASTGEPLSGAARRTARSPTEESGRVAAQPGRHGGLAAAHDKGIVHRDLKPGNVMLRPDGTVKVLDFGLARAMAEDPSTSVQSDSPTITANYTRPGVVLGTAPYMSPEQARGRKVDKRTDIWSFGCVLYECLTGKVLFPGETATDSMGAVLHKEPEWELLPPDTPPTVHLLLRRCLSKDRKKRLHDIADARIELDQAIDDPTATSLGLARAALEVKQRWLPAWPQAVALLGLLAVAAAAAWLLKPDRAPDRQVRRLTLALTEDEQIPFAFPIRIMAISPSGSHMVFVGPGEGGDSFSQLFLRSLDRHEATRLDDTQNAFSPCFSPDGQWIVFLVGGPGGQSIKKVSVRGGPPTTICSVEQPSFAISWRDDDVIVFVEDRSTLMRVSAAGGVPEPIPVEIGDRGLHLPHCLPGGRGTICTILEDGGGWEDASLAVIPAAGGKPRELVAGGADGAYAPTGHLVYRRENTLMAAPFDLDTATVEGPAVPVLEGVAGSGAETAGHYAFARDGTLVYGPGEGDGEAAQSLVRLTPLGTTEPMSSNRGDFGSQSMSPGGSHIALEMREKQSKESKVYVLELQRDLLRRLTSDEGDDENPIWSADGEWIVFSSDRDGGVSNLFRIRSDFSGKVERLTTSENPQHPDDISPDGKTLAFVEETDIYLLPIDERCKATGTPVALVERPAAQWAAEFSPDGAWLAFVSSESGRPEVYVQAVSGAGGAEQVSIGGGFSPQWHPTEKRLLFSESWTLKKLLSARYSTEGGTFRAELPEVVFEREGAGFLGPGFDLAPDGEGLITIMRSSETSMQPRVVVNWFEELRAKSPVD